MLLDEISGKPHNAVLDGDVKVQVTSNGSADELEWCLLTTNGVALPLKQQIVGDDGYVNLASHVSFVPSHGVFCQLVIFCFVVSVVYVISNTKVDKHSHTFKQYMLAGLR
jgi:hypothetical protein